MYGRMARLPIDINMETHSNPDDRLAMYQDLSDPDTKDVEEKRQDMEHFVKQNILAAQKKQKNRYDRIHGASQCFTVGDNVLMKDFRRKKRKGGKLDYRWIGPFSIESSLGKGLFKLKQFTTDKVYLIHIHACQAYMHAFSLLDCIKCEWFSFEKIQHSE